MLGYKIAKLSSYMYHGTFVFHRIFPDCSVKCSFHGYCATDGKCICDAGWTGTNCNVQTCIAKCVNGFCSNATRLCVCDSGFSGKAILQYNYIF